MIIKSLIVGSNFIKLELKENVALKKQDGERDEQIVYVEIGSWTQLGRMGFQNEFRICSTKEAIQKINLTGLKIKNPPLTMGMRWTIEFEF